MPASGEIVYADVVIAADCAYELAMTTWCHERHCLSVVKLSILLASNKGGKSSSPWQRTDGNLIKV